MKKVVIASDSYKNTMSSKEIADIFEDEAKRAYPDLQIVKVVLGDGGENTLEVFANHFTQGQYRTINVTGPNFQKLKADYYTFDDYAVIELAKASGVSLTTTKNPMNTTTYGVGELILHAYKNGYRKFLVALGGSSSNDGGCGLLSALGIQFINQCNEVFIPVGGTLKDIKEIRTDNLLVKDAHFTILSDVNSPMFGPKGAAYVFAAQKGASLEEIELLDQGLQHLNEQFKEYAHQDLENVPGAGAAGATSSGILAFLDSEIVSGIDIILEMIDFDSLIEGADYVFTGEGKLDYQSVNGKLISGVLKYTNKHHIPTICVVGKVDKTNLPDNLFTKVYTTSNDVLDKEQIKKFAKDYYRETIKRVFKEL